jgi:hypothetical protein
MKFVTKALSKRPPTPSDKSTEKSTEKKTNAGSNTLQEVVPRVRQNISLASTRQRQRNQPAFTMGSARARRHNADSDLPAYAGENSDVEKDDRKFSSSEAGSDANIIRVPDYILWNLSESETSVPDRMAPSATGGDEIPGNLGNEPTTVSSDSINLSSHSSSEEPVSQETGASDHPQADPTEELRPPPNRFDPRRQNYQKNKKKLIDVDVFSLAAKKRSKIPAIKPHLPPGMNLKGNGVVFGSHVHMMTPSHAKLPNMPIDQALSQEMTKFHLGTTMQGHEPGEIAGIKVVNSCLGDYHRTMYKFSTDDGNFAELPWPSPEEVEARYQELNNGATDKKTVGENLRKEQIARQVLAFAQNDNNAAFVISSLLHQGISTAISVTATGEKPAFKMLSTQATDYIGRQMTIKDENGNLRPQKIKGLGSATFTLSRDGDDFVISVDFPMYCEARPGREDHVPLHKDGAIGIHAKTEMIVSGEEAKKGVLALKIPKGIRVTYSGSLTF